MTWIATAIIGGAVVSTIGTAIASGNASNAAQNAAGVQANAANQAAQYQYGMYNQTRNDLLPFQNIGRSAIPFVNGLMPGGLSTGNPALPTGAQPGTTTPQLTGYDAQGNPVYSGGGAQVDNSGAGTTFSGATGGLTGGVAAGGNSASPFLNALLQNIPQLGLQAQGTLASFMPGSGNNPLQSSLYSYVNGASNTPNPLLSAANNSILGGSGAPNSALNNLTSFIPGSPGQSSSLNGLNTSLGQFGAMLGLGPSQLAAGQLQNINNQYNKDRTDWLAANPGKTDADWAKTDQFNSYNDQLVKFYQSNPSMAASGAYQAQQQLNDPNFGAAAQTRLDALKDVQPTTLGQDMQTALEQTPGYQFTLDQGLKSVQNSYAAQGLGSSGAALKGAASFATGLADQTYQQQLNNYLQNYNSNLSNYNSQFQNAYNLYNGTSTNALNAFGQQSNLAYNSYGQGFNNAFNVNGQQFNNANAGYTGQVNLGTNLLSQGANAASQTGTIGTQTANNAGGYLTSGAAATAGGIVGSANALNNGITGVTSNLSNLGYAYGLNPGMFSGSNALTGGWSTPIAPGSYTLI